MISPTGGTKKETQLIIHASPRKITQTDLTDPLLISPTGSTKKATHLITANTPEEKYTDKLNRPIFDLSY